MSEDSHSSFDDSRRQEAPPTVDADYVHRRIQQLEDALFELRQFARCEKEPLPDKPFDALEIGVGDSWFLIPIGCVREVVFMVRPEVMVDAPPYVLGTVRFGPEVVPLIDLGARLAGEEPHIRATDVMIVVDSPRWLALAVAHVGQVRSVDPTRLSAPSAGLAAARFIRATYAEVEGRTLPLLSVERIGVELAPDDR